MEPQQRIRPSPATNSPQVVSPRAINETASHGPRRERVGDGLGESVPVVVPVALNVMLRDVDALEVTVNVVVDVTVAVPLEDGEREVDGVMVLLTEPLYDGVAVTEADTVTVGDTVKVAEPLPLLVRVTDDDDDADAVTVGESDTVLLLVLLCDAVAETVAEYDGVTLAVTEGVRLTVLLTDTLTVPELLDENEGDTDTVLEYVRVAVTVFVLVLVYDGLVLIVGEAVQGTSTLDTAGVNASSVLPWPSWPWKPEPQHRTPPETSSTHVWLQPHTTSNAYESPNDKAAAGGANTFPVPP